MDEISKQKLTQATKYIASRKIAKAIAVGESITHPVARAVVLGSAHMEQSQYEKALPHFVSLSKSMPDDITILENILVCQVALNNGVVDDETRLQLGRLFPDDTQYHKAYTEALIRTGTPLSANRRSRFLWLIQNYDATRGLPGRVAECGCWRGMSSLLICNYEKSLDQSFSGQNYDIFDSFEGLSKPTKKDPSDRPDSQAGAFSASLSEVQGNLQEFPDLTFYKGWIPERFSAVEDQIYRFVHVDVDLYEPTDAAIRFFYPRLCSGGRIVCDDYNWSGAREAMDTLAKEVGVPVEVSPSNQASIVKM